MRIHGDATPHNLLVPRDRPDELVVIDWAMGTTAPAGEELGQLLIGGAHEGDLDDGDLVALRDVVVPAYVAGLADEGLDVAARGGAHGDGHDDHAAQHVHGPARSTDSTSR